MPEHPNYIRTERKQVWLTPEGRAAIQAWADREGVSFSAALETLARLGLQQDPQDVWGPLLAAKVTGALRQEFGRFTGLYAALAIDAGVAMRLAAATVKTLRPRDYPRIKQAARLETVALLRQRAAATELGLSPPGEPGQAGQPDDATVHPPASDGHTSAVAAA